jgi:ribosome-associated protein
MENMEKSINNKEDGGMFLIPENEITREVMRSAGPGGQNVNKVATGVRIRWNFENSGALSDEQKNLIRQKLSKQYITREGEVIVKSVAERSQAMNMKRALDRLQEIINGALTVPKERKETKPTRASKERILEEKRKKSDKKKLRGQKYDKSNF